MKRATTFLIVTILVLGMVGCKKSDNDSTLPLPPVSEYVYWLFHRIDGTVYDSETYETLSGPYTVSVYAGSSGDLELITEQQCNQMGSGSYQLSDPTPYSSGLGNDCWKLVSSSRLYDNTINIDIVISASGYRKGHIYFTISRIPNVSEPNMSVLLTSEYTWENKDYYLEPY